MAVLISILMKAVSAAMVIIFIASIILLIFTFRKSRKVSVASQCISIAVSLLSLIIFSILINYQPPWWIWIVMIAVGAAIGIFWSRSTKVYIQDQKVMSKNSIWYLAVWGLVFVVNQVITVVTNRPPDIAMAMLIISTAIVWGTGGAVMYRYFKIKPGLQPVRIIQNQAVPSPSVVASAIQSATATPSAETRIGRPPEKADFCSECGSKLQPDDKFCASCGAKV
jgi:hypothetical protein